MSKKQENKIKEETETAPKQEAQGTGSEAQEHDICNDPHCSCHEEEEASAPASKEEEYFQQLLRLTADYDNYRKRTEREKPLLIRYGKEEVIKKFIPLYDTLLKAKAELSKKDADTENIKRGLNMIFEEFGKVFKSEGVEVLSCKGKPYDPMIHEAITTLPCEEKYDNTVLEEISSGVCIDGKVVRPAQVVVGKSGDTPAGK